MIPQRNERQRATLLFGPDSLAIRDAAGVEFDITDQVVACQFEASVEGAYATVVLEASADGELVVDQLRIAVGAAAPTTEPKVTRGEVQEWFAADGYVSQPTDVVMRHLGRLGLA